MTLLGMDASTISAAAAGDHSALAMIVDEFMPTVLGAAFGLCGDWDLAGDIAQEAFATMVVR
jgi:DNA-directed RNA polymerase specialized sigma24 family protein